MPKGEFVGTIVYCFMAAYKCIIRAGVVVIDGNFKQYGEWISAEQLKVIKAAMVYKCLRNGIKGSW